MAGDGHFSLSAQNVLLGSPDGAQAKPSLAVHKLQTVCCIPSLVAAIVVKISVIISNFIN